MPVEVIVGWCFGAVLIGVVLLIVTAPLFGLILVATAFAHAIAWLVLNHQD